MTAKLFLNNITVIDHGYIGSDGRQHGGSFHASFEVGGNVDSHEQVVIDFSACKKHIKEIVDARENGYDHKVWVLPGWSDCEVSAEVGNVTIRSSALELSGPSNMLRVVQAPEYSAAAIGEDIAKHVEAELAKLYPGVGVTVKCKLTEVGFINDPNNHRQYFRYSHGLRNSSSWGCQNIAHGHLSWLEIEHDEHYREDCQDCQQAMFAITQALSNQWDDAVLIDEANIVDRGDDYISIAYTTPRGRFFAKYRAPYVKYKVLPHETTIEHIVDAFARENAYWLERAHVARLYISEGLAKGSLKEFEHD